MHIVASLGGFQNASVNYQLASTHHLTVYKPPHLISTTAAHLAMANLMHS